MDLGLAGRVALVTGGRRGIGAAIATALAAEGCDVAVVDLTVDDEARATGRAVEAFGRRSLLLEADVRDFQAAEARVADVVGTLGRLDIVVCNAGVTRDGVSWKLDEGAWDEVLDVNLKGCFAYGRAAAPVLRERGWGRIVNVASINGLRGKFGQSNYAASKGGMIALSKSLARELGRYGVTVNVVAPGMVLTEMARALAPEVLDKAVDETVTGRLAVPEDCAHAVAFLCSEAARHITGAVLKVDGGQYI